jgi:ribosomal protein L14E/L6E/L27E
VVKLINKDLLGKVAFSKTGRDAGRYFIIIGIISDNYVYISDGDLRPIDKPKKKKIIHLNISDVKADSIEELINRGDKISNRMVKQYLQSMNSNEEV